MTTYPKALRIENDGGQIVSTNFWDTHHNAEGLFYVSINAGCVRLLTPINQAFQVADMATAREIVLTRGRMEGKDVIEILFDDRSARPFGLWLDAQGQFDRLWPKTDDGRTLPFVIYVQGLHCVVSRGCHLRRRPTLPCLESWKP